LRLYGLDDPEVNGSVCYFPVPKGGDLKGWIGVSEEASAIRSLGRRSYGDRSHAQPNAYDSLARAARAGISKATKLTCREHPAERPR
jgi:hypothetical protein